MTDRKKPTAGFWITVALVAVLVGYLLSSGPALYVIMKLGKPGWLATAADFFYAPLVWALGLSPNWLADSYWNYTFCWDSLAH